MIFNARGEFLAGQGGAQGSLNGTPFPFPSYGGGAFLDAQRIVVKLAGGAGGAVAIWDRVNQPQVVQPVRAANDVYGGGGNWLAFASDAAGAHMWGSVALEGAVPRGVGLDGTIAFCKNYQAGVGLVVDDPLLPQYEDPAWYASELQLLAKGGGIWLRAADGVRTGCKVWGGPPFTPRPAIANCQSLKLATSGSGQDWLVYWCSLGLVAQVDGALDGWILESRPLAFTHDVIADPDRPDSVRIVWSTTRGEGPNDIVIFSVAAAGCSLLRKADGVMPQTPQWKNLPQATEPPAQVPTRPLWVGAFEFQTSPQAPGSCALLVRNCSGAFARPVILDSESAGLAHLNRVLGYFLGGSTVADIEALAETWAAEYRPVAYWDDNHWPTLPELPVGAWLCQRMYQPAGQSLADFTASIDAELARISPLRLPVALVVQAYNTNETLSPDLIPISRAALALASKWLHVVALLLFSGYGRNEGAGSGKGGLDENPDLLAFWSGVLPSMQTPVFSPWVPPAPKPPEPPRLYLSHRKV